MQYNTKCLSCHVHLWSSTWHQMLSAQMNKKQTSNTKRFRWLSETGRRETRPNRVFKILEDTSVAWAHPGSNEWMRRPWYECKTLINIHTGANVDCCWYDMNKLRVFAGYYIGMDEHEFWMSPFVQRVLILTSPTATTAMATFSNLTPPTQPASTHNL